MFKFEKQFMKLLSSWSNYVDKVQIYIDKIFLDLDYSPRTEIKSTRRYENITAIMLLLKALRVGLYKNDDFTLVFSEILKLESEIYRAQHDLFDIIQSCERKDMITYIEEINK